jgi:hypothetical protein
MALPVPNLDNRTYEQILQEARKSISNYTSQWTNHNPADPGVTIIELFSWLADITNYRINLVTEGHCLKYLKLLGIRPHGILPATADLNFETEEIIHLKKGTVFMTEKTGEGIEFELSESITVIPFQLEKIIVNEMSVILSQVSSTNFSQAPRLSKGVFDRTFANYKDDLFFAPFGLETRKNSELYLGFKVNTRKNVIKNQEYPCESLKLMCYIYENDLPAPGKHGDEVEYSFENAKLKWEISLDPEGKKWKEVFPEDRTQNFRKSGSILFTDLKGWICSSLESLLSQENEEKYFWLRCTLLESEYEYPPRIEKINLNVETVIQKKRVTGGVLDKSNGFPGQVFKLPEIPVLRGSLKLNLAGEEWKEVQDFDGSGPESPHFTLDSMKGEIHFGDGLQGKVPPKGAEIQALEYEISRGDQGNLPEGLRWEIKGEKTEGLKISNLKPAVGGKREESISEAFKRFIMDLRVPYRTVASEDFEYIARETPGLRIAQVKIIPNFDPYIQAEREGIVTVVIIPYSPLDILETPPEPSIGFRAAVARHLENHRLLGTRLYIVSPKYVRVEVMVILGISRGFFEEEIQKTVLEKLNLYLHPAKGGPNGKGWPVGKSVYHSEIYRLIMEIKGVDYIQKINILAQKGANSDKNGDLILTSRIATVYSGKHLVEIQAFSQAF